MTAHAIDIIESLETLGYVVIAYHRGRLRIARIGWRDMAWAYRVIDRSVTQ